MNYDLDTEFVESDFLLEKAKSVFGELVIKAYKEKETSESNFYTVSHIEVPEHNFSYDAQIIQLLFANGRLIEFSNSEWASLTLIKTENTI